MSDHLIAEAHRHAMALPTTHPTHADIAWYVREVSELRAEVEESKARERAAIASWDEERQRALREGARVVELRAEVERLKARLYQGCDDERDMAISEGPGHSTCGLADELTARAERAEAEVDAIKQSIEAGPRVLREDAERNAARAERAEAELKEWSLLNLWGGTPEIIHAFIKGQQSRIWAAQDTEAELAAERDQLTASLDMMRDEFMRIIACPGCNAEIGDLANRAQLKLVQRVPVIVQRDHSEAEVRAVLKIVNEQTARAESAERAMERLRSETARIGKNGAEEYIRAERAEAELKRYTDAVDAQPWATDEPIRVLLDRITSLWSSERQAKVERGDMLCECQAELATERARLDWLGSDAGMEFQWKTTTVITRAAIDAAMKEETK